MRATIVYSMLAVLIVLNVGSAVAQETIRLPEPKIRGDVMHALKDRTSLRGFGDRELSLQQIGEIVWAAFGVNNSRSGSRTAASAFNSQEIDVYAVMKTGVYRYDAAGHTLVPVSGGDYRGLIALQGYAAAAPLHLLYVADYRRSRAAFRGNYKELTTEMGHFHAGLIAQNVYLYCMDKDLGTVVRSSIDYSALRELLGLHDEQQIIASQTVGYPAER